MPREDLRNLDSLSDYMTYTEEAAERKIAMLERAGYEAVLVSESIAEAAIEAEKIGVLKV